MSIEEDGGESLNDFGKSSFEYQESIEQLQSIHEQLSAHENIRLNADLLFKDAEACTGDGCAQYAIKLEAQLNDGVKIDPNPQSVAEAVDRAKAQLEAEKEQLNEQLIESRRDANQKLTDLTKVGLDTGDIGQSDLNENGQFNAGKIAFDSHDAPLTEASKTALDNAQTIMDDAKSDTSAEGVKTRLKKFKDWLSKNKYKVAGISAFVVADLTISYGVGKSIWNKDHTPADAAKNYSGCYAMDNKTGNIFKLGMCGYPDHSIDPNAPDIKVGASCTRCCVPTGGQPDPDCSQTCTDGIADADALCAKDPTGTANCSCDPDTGTCKYPSDPSTIPDLVKSGAMYFCTFSGDKYSTSMVACPSTLLACNPDTILGGTCSSSVIANARGLNGEQMSLDGIKNGQYSFVSICYQPNDIFLMCNTIAQNIDYDSTVSSLSKTFSTIMVVIAIFLLVITIIWYGILFYKKFKK